VLPLCERGMQASVAGLGKLSDKSCALLVCDVQERFRPLIHGYPAVIDTAKRLVRQVASRHQTLRRTCFAYVLMLHNYYFVCKAALKSRQAYDFWHAQCTGTSAKTHTWDCRCAERPP
jgi:hypothetical protein